MADDPDPHPVEAGCERRPVIRDRQIGRGRILRIIASQGLHHDRAILDRPGQGPAMVERVGQWEDAAPADPAVGRLEPDDAAIGGGAADRTAGVRPHRAGAQAGGDRRGRAARRAGRIVRGVPRIARRLEGEREIRPADREFMRLLLAEQNRTGPAQPRPGLGILVRHMVEIAPRACRGADAAGLVDVLEADRNAVQRAARGPGGEPACGGEGLLAQHQHIAVQFDVEGRNPIEISLGQRNRRQLARGDRAAGFRDGELGRVRGHAHALG